MREHQRKITELIDIGTLQRIQDDCSKAMGIAFVTVDYRGNPVTQYSGFTKHCMKVREKQGLYEMCSLCDAHGGLHSAITGQPYIYRCHADLVDFALPLILDGSYVGALLGGQARMREEEAKELEYILPSQSSLCKVDPEIRALHEEMEYISYEKMEAAVTVLRDLFLALMKDKENQGTEQKLVETEKELLQERAARTELELTLEKHGRDGAQYRTGSAYFYFVMNIASRLAYEEKADRTESIIYDFTDMTRYAAECRQGISTLGEELRYIEAMLRIQKVWMQENLDYRISVEERHWGVSCPWMILHPILEGMFTQQGDQDGEIQIAIDAREADGALQVSLAARGNGQSVEQWLSWIHAPQKQDLYSLYEANCRLKSVMGTRAGLRVLPQEGDTGIVVQFSLSLKQ